MDPGTVSEVATAIGTVVLAFATIILAIATIILAKGTAQQTKVSEQIVKENRELVEANRDMLDEIQEARIAQNRPHVLVDVDYTYQPALDLVIRNIGYGPAKNVTFKSEPDLLTARGGKRGGNLSNLGYFKDGLDFLAPSTEIRTF